ncbi:Ff.00g056990.m01.CDS01 [Fusarium sp. VM40]|nr:Ff.00g056990.m01.CDS01 [Fusarium sp. VM40]
MGRGGRGSPVPRRPVDLTGNLSVAERNDLTTLITAITEKLHNDISVIFDSPPVTPTLGDVGDIGHHHWLALSLQTNGKENVKPRSPSLGKVVPKVAAASQPSTNTTQPTDKEGSETITPQLRELKKEALIFFRKWQSIFLQRLRDISVTEPTAPQSNMRGRGRGNMRGVRGGRVARGGRGGGRGGLALTTGPPRVPSNHVDRELCRQFPPIPTSLWALPVDKRKLLLHISLLILISLQEYTAYARMTLLNLTSSLNLPLKFLHEEEKRLAQGFSQLAVDTAIEQASEPNQEENKPILKSKARIAAMTGPFRLGAQLIAVGIGTGHTGHGLRLPTAAGLLGPMADNGPSTGSMLGIYMARPTAKMIESFSREIQDFGLIPTRSGDQGDYVDAKAILPTSRRLRLVIAINGWVTDKYDLTGPWKVLGDNGEVYVLRWEMNVLTNIGTALETVVKSSAWTAAKKAIASRTIFSNLIEATWPTELMKVSKIIDNPWSMGMVRAEKAGTVLADAVMRSKIQGDRPVSLIGFSLAARAIYVCLMILAERRQFGLIDSVVLMGTPAPSESRVWLTLKSVVTGRLINVYSESDYLLGFLYRTSNIHFGVAGLQRIQGADGVENHDVSNLVNGHLRYSTLVGKILKDIHWEDLNLNA